MVISRDHASNRLLLTVEFNCNGHLPPDAPQTFLARSSRDTGYAGTYRSRFGGVRRSKPARMCADVFGHIGRHVSECV